MKTIHIDIDDKPRSPGFDRMGDLAVEAGFTGAHASWMTIRPEQERGHGGRRACGEAGVRNSTTDVSITIHAPTKDLAITFLTKTLRLLLEEEKR